MSNPTREQCKEIWEANKRYVSDNPDLNVFELLLFAKKQDGLYLAWKDGDFSGIRQ